MLRIRVLGELALERDDGVVPPPSGRRLKALLAWLALHRGPQPRIEVAGRLWPDVLDESARASLRSALAALRREIGDSDWLVTTRDAVGLADTVWVDLRAFSDLAAAGRADEALALVRGDLLDGLAEEWVYEERDRQRERERELLARLAAEAERRGDLEEAVGHARRRLDRDPLSEDAGRELIRLLAAAGDRPAALATYGRLAERLRRELGVVPGPATRDLVDELRRSGEDDAPPLPAPALPPTLAQPHSSPFVGRAAALATLRRAWQAARAGERRVLLLDGDAGIGKSRLTAELARLAHGAGATVLYGRSHADAIVPYEPFTEAVRPFLATCAPEQVRRMGGPLAGELVRLVPDQADCLPPLESVPASDPEGARYRLFEACASLLAGAARIRPVLLVLEDLHWADSSSLALLRHLARGEPAPLYLLGTYRGSDLGAEHPLNSALAELRREPRVERVALEGLGDEDVGTLAASWLGGEPPRELTRSLAEATGGNPLFVEEVLQDLGAQRAGGGADALPLALDHAPRGVQEVIAERLDLLGEAAQEALRVAAVAGREFDLDLIADAAGVGREDLVEALELALRAQLIRDEPGRPGRLSFRHALIREAIHDRLSAPRRTLLHERVAAAIERRFAGADLEPHLAELAHHYASAGGSPELQQKAVDYAARAGRSAGRRLAHEEAAHHYELALDALGGSDARMRAELACELGEARLRAAGLDAARPAFDEAATAARAVGAPDLLARAALGRSGLGVVVLAPNPETVALLEEALEAVGGGDPALRSRLLARLSVELYHASPERREQLSAEALEIAREAGGREALLEALSARHVALWSPAHLAERLALADEMIELAEAAGDRERALQGYNWRVTDLCEQADFTAAGEAVEEHGRRADELRLPSYQWWAPTWRAMLAIADGRFDEAERHGAEAGEIGRRTNEPTEALFGWYQALYIRSEREPPSGDLPDYVPERVALRAVETAFRPALPAIYAEAGRAEDAQAMLDELAAGGFGAVPRDFNWPSSVSLLARGVALLGDAVRAAELYDLLLPYRERAILVGRAGLCHGPAELYLGLLASVCERWSAAEGHYEAALGWAESAGAGLSAAWAQTYWAEMLLARGDPGDGDRAAALATEALAFAEERGLGRIAARARRAATGPLPAPPSGA